MSNIVVKNKHTISFKKGFWSEEEVRLSKSLGLKEDVDNGGFLCDIRKTSKKSVLTLLKASFSTFMLSPSQKVFREKLFSDLKNMYDNSYDSFKGNILSKVNKDMTPYWHQEDAWFKMINRQYNLLAFDMGTGKTFTSSEMSRMLDIRRTIVVCPSLVKWNWFHELSEKYGHNAMEISILDSKKNRTIKAFYERWCIVNFEMVEKHIDHLLSSDCKHIIIDECQYVKNSNTVRYKGIAKLVKKFPDARVTLLSGTPITNRINDMFAYLKLCKQPLGKNYTYFLDRYTISSKGSRGIRIRGAKNIPELRGHLSNFMIRRKSEECLDLPELIISKYYFKNEEFREEYEEALDEFIKKKFEYENMTPDQKVMAKQSLKSSLHTLNRIVALAKLKGIKELVASLNEMGRKVIIFSTYRQVLSELQEHYGDSCVKIDGSVSAYNRDKYIQRFIKEDKCTVFLGQTKAAGVGINLVNSQDVIFCNFPFTPDELEQSYKRAHRIGQNKNVNVYYTICEDTIDENIYSMVADKSADINELIDKDKKGVVNYHEIEDKLFNSIVEKYKKQTA